MADEKGVEKQKDSKQGQPEQNRSRAGLLQWGIMGGVVIFSAAAGLGLGRLSAGYRTAVPASGAEPKEVIVREEPKGAGTSSEGKKVWYYDLEPVVANLDEPGVTRYVRATLTLVLNAEVDQKKGTAFLDEKKRILVNWLTIYLAGLNLEQVRGEENLLRIRSQILDTFNEKLFPDAKPKISTILFKEFAIQ